MKKEFWKELLDIFNENEELKIKHELIYKTCELIVKSSGLQKELEEISKELEKLNK